MPRIKSAFQSVDKGSLPLCDNALRIHFTNLLEELLTVHLDMIDSRWPMEQQVPYRLVRRN